MRFIPVINMAAFQQSVIRQATPIIEKKLTTVRTVIIEEFNAPKSGRQYRRPSGARYTASAAGEPPAIRSGNLMRSISQPDVRQDAGDLVGVLNITAPYAWQLERGTPRISPRPFVRPAIEEILRRRT